MKIVVAVKQVPARDSALHVAASGKTLEEADLSFEINEPDAYALEEALHLKQEDGEVVALCLGPERAAQVLRDCLAKGADRAIHIDEAPADPLESARLLAAAISTEAPDLVITGLESEDAGHGQTGAMLAELLGLPHVSLVVEVESAAGALRVNREWEDGWLERIELPLPALLTVQSGIRRLRYATLMGLRRARSKEIKRLTAQDLGSPAAASALTLERLWRPERRARAQIFTGSPQEAARQLAEKLRR